MRGTLKQMLEEIEGVVGATVEWSDGEIVGLRVELDEGADERVVGSAVRDLLDAHGYRAKVAPEHVKDEPPSPPPPPPRPPLEMTRSPRSVTRLTAVTVREGRDEVVVSVEGVGRTVERRGRTTIEGRREAIVAATAALWSEDEPVPRLVEYSERDDGVLLIVLEMGNGSVRAGASVIAAGPDLALARAVVAAVTG